jgi:hypothetical protein
LRQIFTRHHNVNGGCKKEHELRKEEADDTTWLTKGGVSNICITRESFATTKLLVKRKESNKELLTVWHKDIE